MRITLAVAVACLGLGAISAASEAQAAFKQQTNIPAQGLGAALQAFAKDRNLQLVYANDEVDSLRTSGAVGDLTPDEALKQILKGTGLTYRYLDDVTLTVQPIHPARRVKEGASASPPPPIQHVTGLSAGAGSSGEGAEAPRAFWSGFLAAQGDQGGLSSSTQAASGSKKLEEVVVTAQKREEDLLEVPIPVTALNAQTLADNNQLTLQEIYQSIPALNVSACPPPCLGLTIRGVHSGGGDSTTALTIDGVPYGGTHGTLVNVANIDPSDLTRVEVLRGPQGTLYGVSSMGGLINFVTLDPTTDSLSGRVQAGTSSIYNGDGLGYAFRGSVNAPLTDTLAVRASSFYRNDPGYIDNPVLGIRGINSDQAYGGHVSALWKPSGDLSVKFSALLQNYTADGNNDVDLPINGYVGAPLGDLQQNYPRGVGINSGKVQAYSAIVNTKLGSADLVSITGYNRNDFTSSIDVTPYFLGFAQATVDPNTRAVPAYTRGYTGKFSQEVRITVPLAQRVEWMVGGFYTHEYSPYYEYIFANDSDGAHLGSVGFLPIGQRYQEYAGFTNFTVNVTNRFDVQIGGRQSAIKTISEEETSTGPIFGGRQVSPRTESTLHSFTYLLTPRFRVSPDLMVYARLASGYRPGGPNAFDPNPNIPRQYEPDKTKDYEIGTKGDWLGHRLTFDASLYYIDWSGIQVTLADPTNSISYTSNGGHAKSEGAEFTVQARPISGLTVGAWVAWNNAVLTETFPLTSTSYGLSGDRLPNSSRISGSVSIDGDLNLTSELVGFAGASAAYVGNQLGGFNACSSVTPSGGCLAAPPRQNYAGYPKADLRAGARYQTWTLNLYVNNVTDKRGIIGGGTAYVPPYAFVYIQPRTVGLNVTKTF